MRGTRFCSLVVAGAVLAAACTKATPGTSRSATPTTTSSSTAPVGESPASTASTGPPAPLRLGPLLTRAHLGHVPSEGVAFAVGQYSDGVALMGLDGHVIGHLEDAQLALYDVPAGPLVIRNSTVGYLLEPGASKFVNVRTGETERIPLAYGAELGYNAVRSPGSAWVEQHGRTVLELGSSGFGTEFTVANDRDIVTLTVYGTKQDPGSHRAFDLRTDTFRSIPGPCEVADRHGQSWYLVCQRPLTVDPNASADTTPRGASIEVMTAGSSPRVLFGEPVARAPNGAGATGQWVGAYVSPDGRELVAQWSGECEAQAVYFGRTNGGTLTPLGALLGAPPSLEATVAGWTLEGQAVVLVPSKPGCGEQGIAGIYLVRPDGKPKRIYAIGEGQDIGPIALWQPALE